MIHVDTSFLVDLLRELGRRGSGPAVSFLEAHPGESLAASVFVLCELQAGVELSAHPEREREKVARLAASLGVVRLDETSGGTDGFVATYGRVLARLQRSGARVGTMDLLIAATAIVSRAPLLTRNRKDFERIPELEIMTY